MLAHLYRISLLLLSLNLMACNTLTESQRNQSSFNQKYADRVDTGATHLKSNYYTSWEKTLDGSFVFKQYYPSTGIMTDYQTFSDRTQKILHGISKRWYDDGTLWWERPYLHGKAEGLWKYFHKSNGELKEAGRYKSDKKEGPWNTYDSKGRLQSVYYFREGKEDGVFKVYHKNGQVLKEGEYEQGELLWNTTYDSTGAKIELPEEKEQMPMYKSEACKELETQERKQCADKQMLQTIYRNIRYPSFAVERNIEGTVIVQFVIEKNGQISDIEVLRGLCDPIRAEALRVTELLSEWWPGEQNGNPVKVQFNLPIRFRLK